MTVATGLRNILVFSFLLILVNNACPACPKSL